MRIAHFVHYYTPAIGGGVRFIAETGARLEARGHTVTVFTSNALNDDGFMSLRKGPSSRFRGPSRERIRHVTVRRYRPLVLPLLQRWVPFLQHGPIMPKLLVEFEPSSFDLVHSSAFPYAHNFISYYLSRRAKLPLYLTPYYKPGQPSSRTLQKILRRADRISASVPWERSALVREFRIDATRVDIVPSGVDPERFGPRNYMPASSCKTILFVGRLTPAKGVGHLLTAYNRYLYPEYPDLRLLVVGYLSDWARRNLLPAARGNTIFLGPICNETELARIYAESDVVCYPSRDDCFPHVFLEAWATSKPVIGCRIGGVADVIQEGKNGLFSAFGDPKDLSEKIAYLLDNPTEASRMGRRGRKKVLDTYVWDKVTDRLEESYRSTINKH